VSLQLDSTYWRVLLQ